MTSDHLFAMPKAGEEPRLAKIYFKWAVNGRARWYKLGECLVEHDQDGESIRKWLLAREAADYHHAVRYGRPVPKSELPQFLYREPPSQQAGEMGGAGNETEKAG